MTPQQQAERERECRRLYTEHRYDAFAERERHRLCRELIRQALPDLLQIVITRHHVQLVL